MSRLLPRAFTELDEAQQELFRRLAQGRQVGTDGQLGGPFDAWMLNAEMGRRVAGLGNFFRFRTGVDRRYVELAILITGQFWQAQFEWYAHEPMAREAGVPEDVIQAIKVGGDPDFADPADEICYRLCTSLHQQHGLDDATYAAAVRQFGDQGVSELVGVSGYYSLVSMTLNAFRVELPPGVQSPFPDPSGAR